MADIETERYGLARLRADILWAIEPFVRYQRKLASLHLWEGEIFIEPCADGGVIVVAVTDHAMAVFHDATGHATCAMTISVPTKGFAACATPAPVEMTFEGQPYAVPLPEYLQPGQVYVSTAGMFVAPKIRPPCWADEDDMFHPVLHSIIECGKHFRLGEDYKWTEGVRMDWLRALKLDARRNTIEGPAHFHPQLVSLFDRAVNLPRQRSNGNVEGATYHFGVGRRPAPTLVQVPGLPCFLGAFMAVEAPKDQQPIPTFFEKRVEPSAPGVH